jgi:hypothetical protein
VAKRGREERNDTRGSRVSFLDRPFGPPTPASLWSQIPSMITRSKSPTSLYRGEGRMAKTHHDRCHGSYLLTPNGPPLVFSIPTNFSIEFACAGPHLFGKGRGGCGFVTFEGAGCCFLSPHPSEEGRGSLPCVCVQLAANWGGESKVVVAEE